jgi:glycogen(starch) synthase
MRILIWSDTFYPHIGGVEVMGAAFARSLQARGHEIVIVAGPYEHHEDEPIAFHGIPLYRFAFEYQRAHHLSYNLDTVVRMKQRLATLLESFRPDIFHFYHTAYGFIYHLQRLKRETAPTLLTLHGPFFGETPAIDQARLALCKQVDWTTACSHYVLDDTRAVVPEIAGHSSVIHNALAMPQLEPSPLDFDEPRFLYLGRLVPEKGVDLAIEAFARVYRQFPRARLVIAGRGNQEHALQQQAQQLGIAAAVDFLGWVTPYEVPALINQATIMLVPSRDEPFCLSALQGGQMARPMIATRVGGLPEVIVDGQTGLLVEPESPAAIVEAMTTLLTEPERAKRLGSAARTHVQQRFDWSTFVDAYEALYARLVGKVKLPV